MIKRRDRIMPHPYSNHLPLVKSIAFKRNYLPMNAYLGTE